MHIPKSIVFFSCLIALLAVGLQYLEYQYWIRSLSAPTYAGIIALVFMVLGIWLGQKRTGEKISSKSNLDRPILNTELAHQVSLSKREIEVLQLISEGYSNQEIADQLYVSLSTVKTHVSNLFSKLNVQRRTQAIKKIHELGLSKK